MLSRHWRVRELRCERSAPVPAGGVRRVRRGSAPGFRRRKQKAGTSAMSVFAEVLQYRPFRRVFPPAGAGRIFSPQYYRVRAERRGSAFITMPSAVSTAAARTRQAHF
ncbi:conserved protein of unknown function [Paraburkholderia dioscoreae]|uniref:Uncharacterized protein n=1 Tax=Paraburkholderia dioscoreae TaxID=2604047 RepID=A0A5Q4Z8K7_9BURK|nr:conserved protein of unknown function [Paraburkholderia dioscoreae]